MAALGNGSQHGIVGGNVRSYRPIVVQNFHDPNVVVRSSVAVGNHHDATSVATIVTLWIVQRGISQVMHFLQQGFHVFEGFGLLDLSSSLGQLLIPAHGILVVVVVILVLMVAVVVLANGRQTPFPRRNDGRVGLQIGFDAGIARGKVLSLHFLQNALGSCRRLSRRDAGWWWWWSQRWLGGWPSIRLLSLSLGRVPIVVVLVVIVASPPLPLSLLPLSLLGHHHLGVTGPTTNEGRVRDHVGRPTKASLSVQMNHATHDGFGSVRSLDPTRLAPRVHEHGIGHHHPIVIVVVVVVVVVVGVWWMMTIGKIGLLLLLLLLLLPRLHLVEQSLNLFRSSLLGGRLNGTPNDSLFVILPSFSSSGSFWVLLLLWWWWWWCWKWLPSMVLWTNLLVVAMSVRILVRRRRRWLDKRRRRRKDG